LNVITFTLKDAQGQPHAYSTIPLDAATDGLAVLEGLAALGIVPLAEALLSGGFAAASSGSKELEIDLNVEAIQEQFTKGFLRKNAPLLLKNTTRDGKRLPADNNMSCYNANYGEFLRAIQEVEKANGFLQALSTFIGGDDE
jgi:hypothetical protein